METDKINLLKIQRNNLYYFNTSIEEIEDEKYVKKCLKIINIIKEKLEK